MGNNYGSEVRIYPSHKGVNKNVKYQHIASSNHDYPNLIKLRKHPNWFKFGDKRMIKKLSQICAHEPIHNVITHDILEYSEINAHGYDVLANKFRKQIKKECPKSFRDYMVF